MHTTSISLLERLRRPGEADAWARLVELYTPLLFYWACRTGIREQDAADLVQEVFAVLVQKLPEFMYDRHKSFRGWLRTILFNKWRDQRRRLEAARFQSNDLVLDNLADPEGPEMFWEAEYRQQLVGRALELMQAEFQPTTWKACWETVVSDRPAADVADELGLSVDAVYAAKSRVLRRLRQELAGLWDR
jgi:RNA polymerase sigma-70 factor (ECF subfamily)